MTASLRTINAWPDEVARPEFLRCCGARAWAQAMTARRPFASVDEIHAAADAELDCLHLDDWHEAFAAHPRIGESTPRSGHATGTREWSTGEQAGVSDAAEDVRRRLAAGNDTYYERFGFVFLICATGKGAAEILAALESRLGNDPKAEFAIAADEQRLITHLRLDKLVGS